MVVIHQVRPMVLVVPVPSVVLAVLAVLAVLVVLVVLEQTAVLVVLEALVPQAALVVLVALVQMAALGAPVAPVVPVQKVELAAQVDPAVLVVEEHRAAAPNVSVMKFVLRVVVFSAVSMLIAVRMDSVSIMCAVSLAMTIQVVPINKRVRMAFVQMWNVATMNNV